LIRGGNRFPAFAKPASAGEARSEKIAHERKIQVVISARGERLTKRLAAELFYNRADD
jgi:hypothetical protein